ncbi:AmmeMemoRadiSam system protein B [Candidatus Parcubacteria bacterium]|nr:AmmeMemoRadiSam system protein B [Candidatus Parcubacteria bacterium]
MESSKFKSPSFDQVRSPAMAGQFYPANARILEKKTKDYLESANSGLELALNLKAIIVPHAGYDYSGLVAAHGFNQVKGKETGTVVIICNSHTDYFPGIAIDESDAWETPLGQVPVDRDMAERLVASSQAIRFNTEVHTSDHTLEVQLPFLQTVLKDGFKIVPIVFGNTGDKAYLELASALADNLGENDLVVVSTDLSHYPSYADAKSIDELTLEKIKNRDIKALEEHIKTIESKGVAGLQTLCCGIDGVKTLITLASKLNWDQVEILKYLNSGDVEIDDKARVVGYGSMAFGQTTDNRQQTTENIDSAINVLNSKQKIELLNIAKKTVEAKVRGEKLPEFDVRDERLNWKEGAFVTLKIRGELRGCIGQIIPSAKPLWQVVRDMAVSASTEDPRFPPVSENELEKLEYEISILSAPKRIDDWQKIEMGKHGVIIKRGYQSGVFLPQVATETDWDKETFLSELCAQKAGLQPNCYKDKATEIQIFTAQVFGENK